MKCAVVVYTVHTECVHLQGGLVSIRNNNNNCEHADYRGLCDSINFPPLNMIKLRITKCALKSALVQNGMKYKNGTHAHDIDTKKENLERNRNYKPIKLDMRYIRF